MAHGITLKLRTIKPSKGWLEMSDHYKGYVPRARRRNVDRAFRCLSQFGYSS